MLNKEFPILEFDEDRDAFIKPSDVVTRIDIAENCVLCFFPEAIEKILSQYPHKLAAQLQMEAVITEVYELEYGGTKVVLVQAGVGAPIACAQIEELTALGCRKYIACGSCGVLRDDIAVGHAIIPISAVRDEGASYHYLKPSREIEANGRVVQVIEDSFNERKVPYIKAKTWTTDAFYRETPAKIKRRRDEGCVTVDMEASAFMAVSQFNGVEFGQILYAGDNLGGESWDSRDFYGKTDSRELVLRLALDACIRL